MDDLRAAVDAAFDPAEALAVVGGDKELFLRLVARFRENRAGELASIRHAIRHRNREALRRAAQRFQGTLGALAAGPARRTAALLEEAGRRGDFASAETMYAEMEQQLRRLEAALMNWS
jgi:HPt (histidine-containing phosphotransfer) domain-containing protein